MKPQSRKSKGRRLQNWVAQQIAQITNLPVGKDEHIAPREMGQSGPDIRLSPLAREAFPFSIECKNSERWNLTQTIQQAINNSYPNTNWLVILKRNNYKPIAVIDAEIFFNLLK